MDLARLAADTTGVRSRIAAAVAARADDVVALGRAVHADPELSFAEHRAARAVAELLRADGFAVEAGVGGLETAFTATAGTGPLTVALCVEYDALPDVGHACGHNLIAGAGVAAAVGLRPLVDELGLTLKVIGTPAEEHGGGKTVLLDRGVFDDVAMALMVHPLQEGLSYDPVGTTSQAVGRYRATFRGRAAHAAAAPHLAVNAADAAVVAQVAVGLLRQQLPSDHRVALFVSEAGHATNIIPDRAVVDFECRAFTLPEYEALLVRVRRCFEAGALATGAELEITATEPLYEPLEHDPGLCARWSDAISFFGHDVEPGAGLAGGSTDMGNVSRRIPSIHPWIGVPGCAAPIHSHDFAAVADSPAAYDLMLEAGVAMAWTVAAVSADEDEVRRLLDAAASRRVRA
ncbi:amidohydrolase [Georgenia sp. EYE_87]|uniref:amidohydrolase n=1 Tax=Georgenia sp. EYE_87 TaxID=2853448 RepID=UPI002003CDFC|nr:amidohydrolase [Georgenia sp. EYE_87]MCK6211635.1 amidohydrolase [Georgenia sp. EYE_87]